MGLRRRVERVEGRLRARASPGIPANRTPEQEAERERQFRRLYMQIGGTWPPPDRDPALVREELFREIARHREETDRKPEA